MADIKNVVTMVVLAVVFITAAAALITPLNAAGLNPEQLCESASCFYNGSRSDEVCTQNNETPQDSVACVAAGSSMPLSSMWDSTSVVPLAFGAFVIIILIGAFMAHMGKKKGII